MYFKYQLWRCVRLCSISLRWQKFHASRWKCAFYSMIYEFTFYVQFSHHIRFRCRREFREKDPNKYLIVWVNARVNLKGGRISAKNSGLRKWHSYWFFLSLEHFFSFSALKITFFTLRKKFQHFKTANLNSCFNNKRKLFEEERLRTPKHKEPSPIVCRYWLCLVDSKTRREKNKQTEKKEIMRLIQVKDNFQIRHRKLKRHFNTGKKNLNEHWTLV